MAETIKGGAYRTPDGRWVDANGKPIAAPREEVYKRPEEETPLTAEEITPGAELLQQAGADDEYETPEDEVSEGQPRKARRVTKKG